VGAAHVFLLIPLLARFSTPNTAKLFAFMAVAHTCVPAPFSSEEKRGFGGKLDYKLTAALTKFSVLLEQK
jgi:hypothetical protein